MKKIVTCILLIILLFSLVGCSSKSAKQKDEIWSTLASISEDLRELSSNCLYAYESEDYDEMYYTLRDAYKKCEELSGTAEYLAGKFDDF